MNAQTAQRRRVYYALRPKHEYRPANVPSGYRPPYTPATRDLAPPANPAPTPAAGAHGARS